MLTAKLIVTDRTIHALMKNEVELTETSLPCYHSMVKMVIGEIIGKIRMDAESIKLKIKYYKGLIDQLTKALNI